MQQHSIVTFQDPDNNRTITINFEYDLKNHSIEYNVVCEPEMVEGEEYGFNLFLANYLLKGLQNEGNTEKQSPEIKDIENGTNTEESN